MFNAKEWFRKPLSRGTPWAGSLLFFPPDSQQPPRVSNIYERKLLHYLKQGASAQEIGSPMRRWVHEMSPVVGRITGPVLRTRPPLPLRRASASCGARSSPGPSGKTPTAPVSHWPSLLPFQTGTRTPAVRKGQTASPRTLPASAPAPLGSERSPWARRPPRRLIRGRRLVSPQQS